MKKTWTFFERLNEIVYVAGVDTYEIEYMNQKALEAYGIESLEDVRGKKCYQVLQGFSKPCEFCTNRLLKKDHFYEWQYYNPIIGKTYALKDTLVEEDGRKYRMELAIDMTVQAQQKQLIEEYENNEKMVNEGLRLTLAKEYPDEAIDALLEYFGNKLNCDRVYIFEQREDGSVANTYEWCAAGVDAKKENLQQVPFEAVSLWYDSFQKKENVIIQDLELTKEENPGTYEYLKPQNVQTLVASPIFNGESISGFFGANNVSPRLLNHISGFLDIISSFITSLLRRRNLVRNLERLSLYDKLTGLKNRHALSEYVRGISGNDPIAILYCDVMGLKVVNDTKGHQAGDELLLRAGKCLERHFGMYELFRIGGDEFVALCKGITEESLKEKVECMKKDMAGHEAMMALGYVWVPVYEKNFEELLARADENMYEEKRRHYMNSGMDRRKR